MQSNPILALLNMGGGEIILILAIVLILFGARKLPELAKGLGQGIREFKKATDYSSTEMRNGFEEPPAKSRHSTQAPAETASTDAERVAS